ncbi:MAG TPA: Uma2 family endonuclease, partial [Hyphomicrobiaceae bacterium]|nr:Uma2 family endonuclease [Hyphomicrobiaceae bacterium]
SLDYDLGAKALDYARLGLPELWVINAQTLITTVHRDAQLTGYTDRFDIPPNELLQPLRAGHLAVRLADLDLGSG